MTDEEIIELVMRLSKSWRGRYTHNTFQFEEDMIEMCKKVRENIEDNLRCEHPAGCSGNGKCWYKENT